MPKSKTPKPLVKSTQKEPTKRSRFKKASLRPSAVRTAYKEKRKTRKTQKIAARKSTKLSSSFRLTMDSASLLRQHWRLFGGISIVYLLLSMLFVGGLAGGLNIEELQADVSAEIGSFLASITLYSQLLGTAGTAQTEAGGVYQSIILIIISLAVIWSLRQIFAGKKIGLRDVFYKSMYPLIPFIFVLAVIMIQLIPMAVGGFLYSIIYGNGIAVTPLEIILWSLPVILLTAVSLYFVCSSIFAMYIVTLPDMRPMKALRSARGLVRFKRWGILRKLLLMVLIVIFFTALVVVPLIIYLPVIVPVIFALLGILGVIFAHTYTYSLYRELL